MGEEWEAIKAYNLDRIQAPGRLSSLRRLMEQFGMCAIPADVLARIAVPTTLIWDARIGRHHCRWPRTPAPGLVGRYT